MAVGERRHRGRVLAAALLAGSLAVACGSGSDEKSSTTTATTEPPTGEWATVVDAAEKEGKVTVYTAQTLEVLEVMEPAFEKAYPGIDLEVVRGLPQDLKPKIDAERKVGKQVADVYMHADQNAALEASASGGAAQPIGPNFDAEGFDREALVTEGGVFNSHAVVFGWGWNTGAFPDGLASYEDLLDPELGDGKIGVVEPSNQALTDFWVYLEDNLGKDYVEKLAAQKPRIYPAGGPAQEAMSSGEIVATVYAGTGVETGKANGAPIDWKVPENPWGARYWVEIMGDAPHANAAQVFADWLVGVEGQSIVAAGGASALAEVDTDLADLASVHKQDTERITAEFAADYLENWKRLFS